VDPKSVRAVDAATGRLLWQRGVSHPQYVVAGDGGVYYLSGDVRRGESLAAVAVDLPTGQVRWQQTDYPWLDKVRRTVCHSGLMVYEISTLADEKKGNEIQVVSATDGKPRWSRQFVPGMNHSKQARAMFVSDSLWVLEHLQGVGLDPQTGNARCTWEAGHCHCFPPVATARYLFSGEMHLTDLASGALDANRITKAACGPDAGWVPANGLIYVFPKACVCWPMLRGVAALATDPAQPAPRRDAPLMERGEAEPPADAPDVSADWPCYRQNAWRSGSTARSVPSTIRPRWTVAIGDRPQGPIAADWADNPFARGPLTSPVIAGSRVYCARPDVHEVVSLNATDGRIAWRFVANGRVDSAPTIHRGLCLFGTRSGWVYCLRADDGRLVWRLCAAPGDEQLVGHGQVESPWPVPGSVLVSQDVAYFTAGRHPLADGGILLFAVEPATGRVRWQQRLDTLPTKDFYRSCSVEFECLDLLSREGHQVAMARWLFDAATGDMQCKDAEAFALLEMGPSSVVVPRSSWTYAPRQNKRHKRDFPLRPLAVYDDHRVFACGGDFQSLFRRDFTSEEARQFDRRWINGWQLAERVRQGKGEVWPVERLAEKAAWTTPVLSGKLPRVAALALAGDTLFAAGSEGGLLALSADSGKLLARYPSAVPSWDGLAASGGRLYLSGADGTLTCFAP
jgi:outer membrane protein assembly factor BamB